MTEKLWSKSFILLIIGNWIFFLSILMLIPTLPAYFKSIGASGLEIGLVTTLFSIGAVLSRPYIGYLLQFRKRKALILIGSALLLLITPLYMTLKIVILLLIFRFIHGLAWGWLTTANSTAVVDLVPNSRLGEGMGFYSTSVMFAMIIAPSLGIYIFHTFEFHYLLGFAALLVFIAFFLMASIQYPVPDFVKQANGKEFTFSFALSSVEKSALMPAFITMFAASGYGGIMTYIVIFGEERGLQHIFVFYIFYAAMAGLFRPVAGKWFDKHGPIGIIVLCSIFTFLGLWSLSFATSTVYVALAGFLFGLGYGSLIPALQSWILSLAPRHRRGVANGMYFSALDIGWAISGIVLGLLDLFLDTGALYQVSSVVYIAVITLTLIEWKRMRSNQKQPSKVAD